MLDLSNPIIRAAVLVIPMIVAIVFHEVSHGLAARTLGDRTAEQMGRLSLNPLKHVDPFGTLILPGMLMLAGWPVFGYAKPVPVMKNRLNNPRRDMMLVAAAGPASNLVMAGIGAVLLGLMARFLPGGEQLLVTEFVAANLLMFITINVFLAVFNLLPIPPFDGSHIVEGLLPRAAAAQYEKLRPYGFPLLFLLLLVIPWLFPGLGIVERIVVPPVDWLSRHYMELAARIAGL